MRMKVSKSIGQPLPCEYYRIIGEIVVNWNWLEYRLHEAIWSMLGIRRDLGRSTTGQLDYRSLAKTVAAVAEMKLKHNPKLVEKIASLTNKLTEKIHSERNQFVHGVWEWDKNKQRI